MASEEESKKEVTESPGISGNEARCELFKYEMGFSLVMEALFES
jgi:hypothetical protein